MMDDVKFLGKDERDKERMSRTQKILIIFAVLTVILIVIVVCATQIPRGNDGAHITPNEPWRELRLPKNIIPTFYNLSLDVYVEQHTYTGNVSILVSITKNTNIVLLHKVGLEIVRTVIQNKDGGSLVPIKKLFYYEPNEFWVIETTDPLAKDNDYVISLKYIAEITEDLSGFHRGNYKDNQGKNVQLASTFFSPISARKAFPCFDEPSYKASFQVTLTHNNKYTALSNMPETGKYTQGERVTTSFQPSINMSTYIVSWALTDFHSTTLDAGHLKLKGWLPRNKNISEIIFGLNVTAVLLPKYEKYFDIPFPLKKLDVVALPQFGPSAMENWGLIFFRQAKFLRNEMSTYDDDKAIVQIMGHELVHQWFGNLATMKFWNEAWLKEGFATYIAYIVFDEVDPSKEFMKDVLPNYMLEAMHLDSYSSSLPISRDVKTPDQIREVFDAITYYKGCCMVQTLFWYMGKDAFKRGMQRYLKTYSYGNADQDDLWRELSKEAGGKDIKAVMDTWTKQLGYPVISTKRLNNSHVLIEQKRFSLDPLGTEPPKSPFNYLWQVPILTRDINTNTVKLHLLKEKKGIFPIESSEVINPDHSMYYRNDYGPTAYQFLTDLLLTNHEVLTELDRTGLISDNFYLFKAKMKTLSETLKALKYIKRESEQVVWSIAMKEMMLIYNLLEEYPEHQQQWSEHVSDNIKNITLRLGWKQQNTYKESALQIIMLTHACELNITSVVQEAQSKFREWMNGSLTIDRNLYGVVRDCAISNAPDEDNIYFKYTYDLYLKTDDISLLDSLTQTNNKKLIQRLLNDVLDTSIVQTNDAPYIVGKIAESSLNGRNLAWKFIKEKWDELFKRYGDNIFLLGRMISSVLESSSSLDVLKDVESFFKEKKDVGSAREAIKRSISEIRSRFAYKNTILEDTWFNKTG